MPKITGATLSTDYSYRYICRQTFEEGAYQPHEHERYWFIVGSLANAETNPQQLPSNNYVPIKQLLVQFVFLKDTTAKLAIRSTVTEFQITFQSLQQRRTFYEIIYRNVILTKAVSRYCRVIRVSPTTVRRIYAFYSRDRLLTT